MRPLVFASLGAVSALWAGCTFGGLANYTIDSCDPAAKTQAEDVCDRLSTGNSCTPYQCDPASRHCVAKARDDDRDGDPSPACGGTDCDDADPKRSGRAPEVCDGVDNNCNALVDEDALGPLPERVVASPGALTSSADASLAAADESRLVGAYVSSSGQGTCIPLVELEHAGGQALSTGCYLLADDPSLVPRQPVARLVADGAAAAFVATGACPSGRLAYRFHANASAGFDLACDPAHPAALPTLSAMPADANAKSGVVAWLRTALADRLDPVGACATVKPAPIAVAYVADLTSPGTIDASSVLVSDDVSSTTRPPALLPLDAAHGVIMAAAYGADVGVWLLTPSALQGGALPPATHVPALAGAHEVAIAARADGASVTIAVVASVGCHPAAGMRLVLGALDESGAFTFGDAVDVQGKGDVATLPSVAWVAPRREWWAAWIDAKPHHVIRRFGADAKSIGGPIDVGKAYLAGAISAAGSSFGFDPTAEAGSFVEVPIGCAR